MNYNDVFYVYKMLYDESKGLKINPLNYQNINIKDNKKIDILVKLINSNFDINKFFTANIVQSKNFFIEFLYSEKGWNIAVNNYYIFIDILKIKRKILFRKIVEEAKKIKRFDFENRDEFIKLINTIDYKLFSLIYPENKELIISLNDKNYMEKIIKMNMVLRNMSGYKEIKEKILKYLRK